MTKKFFFSLMSVVMMALVSVGFAACSSSDGDDNGGSGLDKPKYEDASALYNITESGSDYKSIEFTASGNYLITKKNYITAPNRIAAVSETQFGFLEGATGITRSSSSYGNIIYGTYTKNGDTYVLDGFGTIVVKGGGSNAISLDITTNDGNKITLGAQQGQQYSSSDMTNKLCRTWNLNQVKVEIKTNGESVLNKTFNGIAEYLIGMAEAEGHSMSEAEKKELRGNEPKQVIFTKSGTYIVYYANETLAVSTWKWINESKGEARYSWDYEAIDSYYESNIIYISFEGSKLIVSESYETMYNGSKSDVTIFYYFIEAK